MLCLALKDTLRSSSLQRLDGVGDLLDALTPAAVKRLQPYEIADAVATLGVAAADADCSIAALLGDGVVAWETHEGEQVIVSVHYEDNRPRYPIYDLLARTGQADSLATWKTLVEQTMVVVDTQVMLPGSAGEPPTRTVRKEVFPAVDYPGFWQKWPKDAPLKSILVASDGCFSFAASSSPESITGKFLGINKPFGVFVQRCMGALARGWRKNGGMPEDDLSVGMLRWHLSEMPPAA